MTCQAHTCRRAVGYTWPDPRTGEYERGFGSERKGMLKISRADVADFLLDQLDDDTYLRRTPAVSY